MCILPFQASVGGKTQLFSVRANKQLDQIKIRIEKEKKDLKKDLQNQINEVVFAYKSDSRNFKSQ